MVLNANLRTVKTHQLAAAFLVIDQGWPRTAVTRTGCAARVVISAAPGLGATIATRVLSRH